MLGLASTLLLATSTSLAPVWESIAPGMTVEELQAAFPPSKDIIYRDDDAIIRGLKATSDCPATVYVDLQDGMVRSLTFAGEPEPLTHCLRSVRNALISRYGKPKRIRGARYLWRTPVVEITLGSQPADVPTWVESMTASHEWIVCVEPSSDGDLSLPGPSRSRELIDRC